MGTDEEGTERESERDRQTDRQTDRQRDRERKGGILVRKRRKRSGKARRYLRKKCILRNRMIY